MPRANCPGCPMWPFRKRGGHWNTVSPRAQCTAPHAPSTPAPQSCSANPLLTPSRALCRLGLALRYTPDSSWWQCFARGLILNAGCQSKSNPLLMRNPPRLASLRAAAGIYPASTRTSSHAQKAPVLSSQGPIFRAHSPCLMTWMPKSSQGLVETANCAFLGCLHCFVLGPRS